MFLSVVGDCPRARDGVVVGGDARRQIDETRRAVSRLFRRARVQRELQKLELDAKCARRRSELTEIRGELGA